MRNELANTILHLFVGALVATAITYSVMSEVSPMEERMNTTGCFDTDTMQMTQTCVAEEKFIEFRGNEAKLIKLCSQIGQIDCYLYVEDSGDISGQEPINNLNK